MTNSVLAEMVARALAEMATACGRSQVSVVLVITVRIGCERDEIIQAQPLKTQPVSSRFQLEY